MLQRIGPHGATALLGYLVRFAVMLRPSAGVVTTRQPGAPGIREGSLPGALVAGLPCCQGSSPQSPRQLHAFPARSLHVIAGVAVAGCLTRSARRRLARYQRSKMAQAAGGRTDMSAPADLYGLLQVSSEANDTQIKKAYHKIMKVCHPDVAGEDGEEMCILLNDAYSVLSDPDARALYNAQLDKTKRKEAVEALVTSSDLGPVWQWRPKRHGKRPVWEGIPRSRSKWDKVPEEDRGQKHAERMFVFVDEWNCISCRNCCDVAPSAFCIDAENGRARVYTQWGEGEEWMDYAVSSCPVDCIHWVEREQLQALEHVTADRMFEENGSLPCPMSIRQGVFTRKLTDPFELATEFLRNRRQIEAQQRKKFGGMGQIAADKFQDRILEVFHQLTDTLQLAGWGPKQLGK